MSNMRPLEMELELGDLTNNDNNNDDDDKMANINVESRYFWYE